MKKETIENELTKNLVTIPAQPPKEEQVVEIETLKLPRVKTGVMAGSCFFGG